MALNQRSPRVMSLYQPDFLAVAELLLRVNPMAKRAHHREVATAACQIYAGPARQKLGKCLLGRQWATIEDYPLSERVSSVARELHAGHRY